MISLTCKFLFIFFYKYCCWCSRCCSYCSSCELFVVFYIIPRSIICIYFSNLMLMLLLSVCNWNLWHHNLIKCKCMSVYVCVWELKTFSHYYFIFFFRSFLFISFSFSLYFYCYYFIICYYYYCCCWCCCRILIFHKIKFIYGYFCVCVFF